MNPDNETQWAILRQWFPGMVGQALQCRCGAILDCKSATHIEVKGDDTTYVSRILCKDCTYTAMGNLDATIEKLKIDNPSVELIQGRQIWPVKYKKEKTAQ